MTATPRTVCALVVLAAGLLAACGDAPEAAPRLYTAASLVPVVGDLVAAGAPALGSVSGPTPLVVRQIRSGASPGVLIAADAAWADALEADDLVEPGTRVDLLLNRLVVVAAAGSALAPGTLADLADPDVRRVALAETQHVPAGRYARAALTAAGVWDAVRPRVVEVSDARAVVALIARGEADLGITYATLAADDRVQRVLEVPADTHPRIVYPLLLVRGAPPAARELWTWLQGPDAAAVFERAGFGRPGR